jgi:hypothetical protein
MLVGGKKTLHHDHHAAEAMKARFERLASSVSSRGLSVAWESDPPAGTLLGSAAVLDRTQPFTLLARSAHGRLVVRCVSPVGFFSDEERFEDLAVTARAHAVRMTTLHQEKFDQYDVAAEADVLLGSEAHDAELVSDLIRRVTAAADQLERELLRIDQPLAVFEEDLKEEIRVAR